jgi:hypothetical protein
VTLFFNVLRDGRVREQAMRFFDMLTQVIGLLVLERQVSYRTLKLLAPICG